MEQTLYKIDSRGEVRQWTIETVDDEVLIIHGLLNGKLVEESYIAEPTNIGRKNYRDSIAQAEFEAQAKVDKQLRLGYFLSIEDARKNADNYRPMKVDKYFDEDTNKANKFASKLGDNVIVQTKHDGVNCSVIVEDGNITFRSRGNTNYDAMQQTKLAYNLTQHLPENVWVIGELANEPTYFEVDCAGAVKSKSENILHYEDYENWSAKIDEKWWVKNKKKNDIIHSLGFYIFDIYIHGDDDFNALPYIERLNYIEPYIENVKNVETVEYTIVQNDPEIIRHLLNDAVADGKEGLIVRSLNCKHQSGKRSKEVLKAILMDKLDRIIDDIYLSAKNKVMFTVGDVDLTYNASNDENNHIFENKDEYIGQVACIRYRGKTSKGKIKFGKIIIIRGQDV
jgi:ATP-dependent DNA ligase